MTFPQLFLAAGLFLAGVVQAQPIWTFSQVRAATLSSHPALLGKRSAQVAAQADRQGAEWQRYPTPSVQVNTLQSDKQHGNQNPGLLRLEQPLWTGGRITAGIEAAGSRLDAAGAALDEEGLALTLKVIAAYTEALRQKTRLEHAAQGLKEHEKLLRMIRQRVEHEVSSQADQRLAESRLQIASLDLSLANQALDNALAQLSQLAGEPVRDVAALEINEPGTPENLETALRRGTIWSPSLRRLVFEAEAANADVDSKRSALMPQLALRVEQYIGLTHDSRAMLVLEAQPGAGLSAGSGVDAAIARREALRQAQAAAERDLRERLTLDWNEWVAARLRLESASMARVMSNEVFESYTRQYVAGRKSWLDVLNSVREATQTAFSVDDAQTQALAASLRLRALGGVLNPGLTEGQQR